MRSWVKWIGVLVLALLVEQVWDGVLGRWAPPPRLALIVGVTLSLRMGTARGAWMMGVAGLLGDLMRMPPDGVDTLAGVVVGGVAGWTGRRIVTDSGPARWVFAAIFMGLLAALSGGLRLVLYGILAPDLAGTGLAVLVWPLAARAIDAIRFPEEPLMASAWAVRERIKP